MPVKSAFAAVGLAAFCATSAIADRGPDQSLRADTPRGEDEFADGTHRYGSGAAR